MIWLVSIFCFAVGLFIGAVLFKQFMSDAAKVDELESRLATLQSEHDHYKNNVHAHFSGAAQLVDNLTESYREVYRHLATGANSLCPESISSQLSLSAESHELISGNYNSNNSSNNGTAGTLNGGNSAPPLFPPRDYADKIDDNHEGALTEGYGLDKVALEEATLEEEVKSPEPPVTI